MPKATFLEMLEQLHVCWHRPCTCFMRQKRASIHALSPHLPLPPCAHPPPTPAPQVFAIDYTNPEEVKPRINPIQRLSTLPLDWSDTNYVGEIKIDAAGANVYVSNRGHNSIATFNVDPATGLLSRAGVDSTLGRCPRHFGLSPCGRYAVVGDQDSDVVKVFRLCPDSGRLAAPTQELDVPTPNFVLFVKPHPQSAPVANGTPAANSTPVGSGGANGVMNGGAYTDGATEAREHATAVQQMASPVTVCAN